MKTLDITARLPVLPAARVQLLRPFEVFGAVREALSGERSANLVHRDIQERIAARTGADRFMVEDQVAVLLGTATGAGNEYVAEGLWSLGRTEPCWGTPWVGIQLWETDGEADLLVRYGGSFGEDDDPPRWVACRMERESGGGYEHLSRAFRDARAPADFWLLRREETIVGRIVLK